MKWFLRFPVLIGMVCIGCASPSSAETSGPKNGTLLIVGGGDKARIWPLFVKLAGGLDTPVVVIPTANVDTGETNKDIKQLRECGLTHLTILHTRDPKEANKDAFVKPLAQARAVWFTGGRQWRLADAYLGTRTQKEIAAVLERGGVVGGSSAGASIQASYLVRGAPAGNAILMAPGHEQGFGLLRDSAIDQHVNTRGRVEDVRQVLEEHHELLGIALDESTAIVVKGDRCEVAGAGHAHFFSDAKAAVVELGAGGRYDLANRHALP